jgi:hypothetical protein
VLTRHQVLFNTGFTPLSFLSLSASGSAGQDVDFSNTRLGRGADLSLSATARATDHLEIRYNQSLRWLNVNPLPDNVALSRGRLFTAQVERLRLTYVFNSRMFVREIIQNIRTNRNTDLYLDAVNRHSGGLTTSFLFAYKLNWQTLMFLGLGDERDVVLEDNSLHPFRRQFFLKLSYAFQR